MRINLLLFLLLAGSLLLPGLPDAVAQCAMCKATVEANQANANKYGVGLNTGILYLMCIPYIAAAILGYLWYKNARVKSDTRHRKVQVR